MLAQRAPVQFQHQVQREENHFRHIWKTLLREPTQQLAMLVEDRIHRLGNARITRPHLTNAGGRIACRTERRNFFRDLGEFLRLQSLECLFNFSDRHGAILVPAPLPSSLHFSP